MTPRLRASRPARLGTLMASLAALACVACTPNTGPSREVGAEASSASSPSQGAPAEGARATPDATWVLAISVDGLRGDVITRLGEAGAPNLTRLLREGASTLNARSAHEATITLPNHTSMLTGVPVDPRHSGHGVTYNDDLGAVVHEAAGRYVPSVFDVVHDHGGRTALFATKDKFDVLARTWNEAGAADRIGRDDGREKIDDYQQTGVRRAVGAAVRAIRRDPATFTFLHLNNPDAVGHGYGFDSAEYDQAVRDVDRHLGRILAAVDRSARQHPSSSPRVILTADHGGDGAGHGDADVPGNYTVPLVVWGPGITTGDLYLIGTMYTDPGTVNPDYTGPQPLRNGQLANLSLALLELPPVPGSTFAVAPELIRRLHRTN